MHSNPKIISQALFITGTLLALLSVSLGNSLQNDLRGLPIGQLIDRRDMTSLRIMGFAFGFPIGVGVALLGALLRSETAGYRILMFGLPLGFAVMAAMVVPVLAGRDLDATFFATGGYLIMFMMLALIWIWGHQRARIPIANRVAFDIQGLGYLFFGLAAWNLCGAATMPSFGLEPEMMIKLSAQSFAIGQMKSIMVLFVMGWLFSLAGFWLLYKRDQGNQNSV